MAAVTTVLYWNAQGTATARPVFAVLEIEQADIDTPAKVAAWLADMGYGADVSLGVLPGDPAEVAADDDTTVNFLTVNPATLATTAAAATNELGERRRAVQSTIDALIAQAAAASAPAQRITLAQWQAHQAYIADLQAARAAVGTSSNPEAVALPALALPGGASTRTVAQQIAALMDDNSIPVSKVLLTDRETLAPEFTFDDNDLGLFTTGLSYGSGWWSLSPSGNLSGGYALVIPATLSSTLLGRPENYFSVTPGDVLVLEAKLQAAAGYDGAVRYAAIFWAQDKATLVSGAASAVNWTPTGSSWQTFRDAVTVPAGAKWATLAITSVAGTTGFARADGLKVKTRLPDDIYLPPAIDAARITGSLPLARLAAIPSGRVLGRAVTDADGAPYGLDGAALKAIVGALVTADIADGAVVLRNGVQSQSALSITSTATSQPAASDTTSTAITSGALTFAANAVHVTATCQIQTSAAGLLLWWLVRIAGGTETVVQADGFNAPAAGIFPLAVQAIDTPGDGVTASYRLRLSRGGSGVTLTALDRGLSVRSYRA